MSLRHEIMKLKAAVFDLQEDMKAAHEMIDLLIVEEEDTAEELAEHEAEDEEEAHPPSPAFGHYA